MTTRQASTDRTQGDAATHHGDTVAALLNRIGRIPLASPARLPAEGRFHRTSQGRRDAGGVAAAGSRRAVPGRVWNAVLPRAVRGTAEVHCRRCVDAGKHAHVVLTTRMGLVRFCSCRGKRERAVASLVR